MKGKCGVCGDAFDAKPKLHEAPGGKYANGIIARKYKAGEMSFYVIKLNSNAMTEVYPWELQTKAAWDLLYDASNLICPTKSIVLRYCLSYAPITFVSLADKFCTSG